MVIQINYNDSESIYNYQQLQEYVLLKQQIKNKDVNYCNCLSTTSKLLDKHIKTIALGLLNCIAGGVFGLIKFSAIVSGFLLLIEKFNLLFEFLDLVLAQQSLLYYPMLTVAHFLYSAIPF